MRIIKEFLQWRKMERANRAAAAKAGHFYLTSKTDTILLEKVIREINANPDLTALFRTSDGTTLSLRVHPHEEVRHHTTLSRFNVGDDE